MRHVRGKEGSIRRKVDFQPLKTISPTAGCISVVHGCVCRCKCGDLIWTCLVWPEGYTPDSYGVSSHHSIRHR